MRGVVIRKSPPDVPVGSPLGLVSNFDVTSVATVGFAAAVFGQILDLIDEFAGTARKAVLLLLVERLICECGGIERRLDLRRKAVAVAGDRSELGQVLRVDRIVAGDGSIGIDEAVPPDRA